ncbi:MAG: hypothetical protein LUD00_03310 [Prevotellaceae bacterium]|nr:hypothetical protein [Prevotellaceae bacterium]
MLFYAVQTYRCVAALYHSWNEKLPYCGQRCLADWEKWAFDFRNMYARISSLALSDNGTLDQSENFEELETMVSDRFKIDVLNKVRNVNTIINKIETCDYRHLLLLYLKMIPDCIDKIVAMLRRPSSGQILAFYGTAEEMYVKNRYQQDIDLYQDKKVAVPMCELQAFAGKEIKECWARLESSGFMDEKIKTSYAPHAGGDANIQELVYKRFLEPNGDLNKDVVSKYIFFNRSKLTDEQIYRFFGYHFMKKYIEKDIPAQKGTGENPDPVMAEQMLHYVDRLSELVAPDYDAGSMHGVWEVMVNSEQLSKEFRPRPREKTDTVKFSKKFVCCVISFMWGRGYYQGKRADFIRLLEGGNMNHAVKNYIMGGAKDLKDCVVTQSNKSVEQYKACQKVIERILAEFFPLG